MITFNRFCSQLIILILVHFGQQIKENFLQMQNFLQCCDSSLSNKIDDLSLKMNNIHDQYIRTSTVYQINNKKRSKQEELLMIQRSKIINQLEQHKKRLEIPVQPITLVLKQKQKEISKLYQTKSLIQDFNKLVKGDQDQMKKLIPLDDKSFTESALKIFIFKQLLQHFTNQEYDTARNQIRKKYAELKNKILINFKQAYYKNDIILMKTNLPYCEEYDLMDEISEFYNEQAFKEAHKLGKLGGQENNEAQIKNFFFLLERGFFYAFSRQNPNTGENNSSEITIVMGPYSDTIARRLISYSFQKIIKQSIENILKSTYNSGSYLVYLQTFYTECKLMLKNVQPLIIDERIVHLMGTYFQSIFDTYFETYLTKETSFVQNKIEQCMSEITDQIKKTKLLIKDSMEVETTKKFSIKKIMDFKIQEKTFNPDAIKLKMETLKNVFSTSSLEKIFMTIKQSLNRNTKISKPNQLDRNRNEIFSIFLKSLEQLLEVLINAIGETIPGFSQRMIPLQAEFFVIVPNVNLVLQRMEYIYIENKKQAKYQFAQGLKVQQKKQSLISSCEKKLNKIVGDALANVLTLQNNLLKSNQNEYFITNQKQKMRQPSETVSAKVISFLQKYLRTINKINLSTYRSTLLKSMGIQFINLLISHYGKISYTKEGLGLIFIDIANYKKIVIQVDYPQIQQKYKVLRSLIDIYVIKNDQKAINAYLKNQRDSVLRNQNEETIKDYVSNKLRNQKNFKD